MQSYKEYFLEKLKLTIEYHDTLNPRIWDNMRLDTKLRKFLIKKAVEFAIFSDIEHRRIKDIVLTGSNANYNYTKYSDFDIHILCDYTGLDADEMYEKKVEWSQEHPDLKVAGHTVEFYAQDGTEQFPEGQGVYSLLTGKWLVKPKHLDKIDILHDPTTVDKVEFYINYIKKYLLKHGTSKEISEFRDKLRKMRKAGLEQAGEFSVENIIYKDLRNRGLLDKLKAKLG